MNFHRREHKLWSLFFEEQFFVDFIFERIHEIKWSNAVRNLAVFIMGRATVLVFTFCIFIISVHFIQLLQFT